MPHDPRKEPMVSFFLVSFFAKMVINRRTIFLLYSVRFISFDKPDSPKNEWSLFPLDGLLVWSEEEREVRNRILFGWNVMWNECTQYSCRVSGRPFGFTDVHIAQLSGLISSAARISG